MRTEGGLILVIDAVTCPLRFSNRRSSSELPPASGAEQTVVGCIGFDLRNATPSGTAQFFGLFRSAKNGLKGGDGEGGPGCEMTSGGQKNKTKKKGEAPKDS